MGSPMNQKTSSVLQVAFAHADLIRAIEDLFLASSRLGVFWMLDNYAELLKKTGLVGSEKMVPGYVHLLGKQVANKYG